MENVSFTQRNLPLNTWKGWICSEFHAEDFHNSTRWCYKHAIISTWKLCRVSGDISGWNSTWHGLWLPVRSYQLDRIQACLGDEQNSHLDLPVTCFRYGCYAVLPLDWAGPKGMVGGIFQWAGRSGRIKREERKCLMLCFEALVSWATQLSLTARTLQGASRLWYCSGVVFSSLLFCGAEQLLDFPDLQHTRQPLRTLLSLNL